MSAEERRQLEREMAVQRADHITSDQYVESRYRSSSWGSRNDGAMPSARRNTFGPARLVPRRDRDRTRRGEHARTMDHRMRAMGFHDFGLDGTEEDHDFERPHRTNSGRYDIADLRPPGVEDEMSPDGVMNLEQLEEMMLREVNPSFFIEF